MDSTRREALLAGLAAASLTTEALGATSARRASTGQGWGRGVEGQRRADLGNGTYRNPVLAGDHPDPSILKDGATYYQVSSSFVYYPGLVIWRSDDLINWLPVGPALREPVGSVYAPDLVKHDGRFYIYFPARAVPQMPAPAGAPPRRPMTNYVIHADRIEGPWSDPIDLGIYTAIDPGHAVGEDGKRYLYVSDGTLVPLSDDGLHRSGPDERLYHGWPYPADWPVETFALEGPKLLRRDGWFYLFSAEGGTAGPPTSHMVIVARSRSIRGPWENCPHNPIVHTASIDEPWWSRGHGTAVEGPSGDWWLLYHGYEKDYRSLGRQALLEPMRWTADGWPQATGGDLSRPLRAPRRGGAAVHGVAPSGPIAEDALGARLAFFRPGPNYRDRIAFEDGTLILAGQGKDPADASPLLMIAGDRSYEVTVELELRGAATAGLLAFYNEKFFCGIGSDPRIFHAYNLGVENGFEARTSAVGTRFHLRLVSENQVARFYYSADGRKWVLHRSYEVAGYNQNVAGGYLSLRPGIYVSGSGSACVHGLAYSA